MAVSVSKDGFAFPDSISPIKPFEQFASSASFACEIPWISL